MWKLKATVNESYAYWNNAFNDQEIETILKFCYQKDLTDGTLLNDEKLNKETRNSKIAWIEPEENTDFMFRRITDIVLELNAKFFNYDINDFENFQFTEYSEGYNGHYKCHRDFGYDGFAAQRKLSIVVQLTDETVYDGGDLLLYPESNTVSVNPGRTKGTLILFPSYILHEVTPVTKGVRNSLVSWVHGPAFK